MSSPNLGLALAGLTAWGLYGYLFSREERAPRSTGRDGAPPGDDRDLNRSIRNAVDVARLVTKPGVVHVRSTNGYVTLSGEILDAEVNDVVSFVRRRPRVKAVRNHLRGYPSLVTTDIP